MGAILQQTQLFFYDVFKTENMQIIFQTGALSAQF